MREHGPSGEKTELIEALGVSPAVARKNIAVLPIAFRAVGLNVTAALACEGAKSFQQGVCAGGDETRRNHWTHTSAPIVWMCMNVVNQRLGPGQSGFH